MKKTLTHLIIGTFLTLPLLVSAADIGLKNPIGVDSISGLILIVTRVVRYIAIPFLVIAIMWAGFLFIMGNFQSSPYKIADAKNVLFYTIIGAFILLSAELIGLVMKNTIEGLTR